MSCERLADEFEVNMNKSETMVLEQEVNREVLKPAMLYHASPNRDIQQFEPRTETQRDPLEGPVVFATPSKEIATQFLVPTDDSWARGGVFHVGEVYSPEQVYFFAIGDRNRFMSTDHGGAVYELPVESFTTDPEKGLGDLEWVSTQSVQPIGKLEYESGLEAMVDAGVQVYFLSKEDYQTYCETPGEQKAAFLDAHQSENQQRGVNVRSLVDSGGEHE